MIENKFGKTICSICYEDLKPIVEDLQVISICGHVFHELCLQQWFEYCTSAKKCTCPVCKQSCSANHVSRLYFQSVGDQNDSVLSQKPKDLELEDPEVLRGEVKRLEVKVSRLNSALDSQGIELREINEELCLCKERVKDEAALKNEALKQKSSAEQLFHLKSQELDKVKLECLKLQQRNMALAKELAALKLVSDLNLDEDEILKFASLGNGANNKDTIDVLRKSLVIRNKNYTELMAKCNLLGREKARSCEKLEKAKEKINKLKTRVQELETVVEVKDNEVLRAMKVSKKNSHKGEILKGDNSNSLCANVISLEDQMDQCSVPINSLDSTIKNFSVAENMGVSHTKEGASTKANKKERNTSFYEETSRISSAVFGLSSPNSKHQTVADVVQRSIPSTIGSIPRDNKEVGVQGPGNLPGILGSRAALESDKSISPTIDIDEDVTLIVDDSVQVQPIFNIKKKCASPEPLSNPGDVCFSSGVLGPDGTNRYLGKWCKRGQNKGSNSGDLIAVGADGRGGRIKVLRSLNQSSVDGKENLLCAKRLKYGAKTSSFQSQGCLQIEHFFGRVGQ